MLLEHYGSAIGAVLIAVVALCSFLLALKAARSIARFRETRHVQFTRGEPL